MIQEFIDNYMARKPQLEALFAAKHPEDYQEVVTSVIRILDGPDPERVHEINYGSYQGEALYIIAAKGYAPADYWYVKVEYGSCSACDTLQAINDDSPEAQKVADYMTLALHIVEGLKKLGEP